MIHFPFCSCRRPTVASGTVGFVTKRPREVASRRNQTRSFAPLDLRYSDCTVSSTGCFFAPSARSLHQGYAGPYADQWRFCVNVNGTELLGGEMRCLNQRLARGIWAAAWMASGAFGGI